MEPVIAHRGAGVASEELAEADARCGAVEAELQRGTRP
jgi:hypothetical protein